jgi:hypothetical protein
MAKKKKYYCTVCGAGPFATHQKLGGHARREGCKKKRGPGRPKKKKGKVGRPKKKKQVKKKVKKTKKDADTSFEIIPVDQQGQELTIPLKIKVVVHILQE